MKVSLIFDLPDDQEEYDDAHDGSVNAAILFDWNELMVKIYNHIEYFPDLDGRQDIADWLMSQWLKVKDIE